MSDAKLCLQFHDALIGSGIDIINNNNRSLIDPNWLYQQVESAFDPELSFTTECLDYINSVCELNVYIDMEN